MALLVTEPVSLLLDVDGDLDMTNGLRFATGLTAVMQGVRTRLGMFRGEWFLDLDLGVPYLERDGVTAAQALLGQKFNEPKARAAFRTPILATPGVLSILSVVVTFDGSTREMRVTWKANTVFGDTPADTLTV